MENAKADINFNELAWNAPKHGDKCGYVPTDEHYDDIINWLSSGTKLYVEKCKQSDGTKAVISRVRFLDSPYDTVVTYLPETKLISWVYRKQNVFEI